MSAGGLTERLQRIERELALALEQAGAVPRDVEAVRVRFLGRKGEVPGLMRVLTELPPAERRAAGQAINELKSAVEAAVAQAAARAAGADLARDLGGPATDVTLPTRRPFAGSLHPVTRTRREMERLFRELGFRVESGPQVEDEFHNFEALNMPPDHPAREDSDTFYLEDGRLLRTHTSPVQIRVMRQRRPPIKMVCPGTVFRRDFDATHTPMFHQLEALVVGQRISMADLKGTLATLWSRFFGGDVAIRLRPGYFPFVEPGCEYDVACRVCGGGGCRVCKQSGWIELGGAGMVHPAVFRAVDLDPGRWSGFAFGLGIDRIAMMRDGIDDLRLLMDGDVRFLARLGD